MSNSTNSTHLAAALDQHARGNLVDAERLYRAVLPTETSYIGARANLGALLQSQGRLAEASEQFVQVLALEPRHAKVLCNLASIHKDLGQLERACELYLQALASEPILAEAHFNLGVVRQQLGDSGQAATSYRAAIAARPNYLQAHNNLGTILRRQGQMDDALACYETALAIDENSIEAHRNRALVWLLKGNFERGWPEYEWRLRIAGAPTFEFGRPRWDGQPLTSGSILLVAEQGLGDTIQFVRYASLVRERSGARVVLQCDAALAQLLARAAGVDDVLARPAVPDDLAAYVPLLSLPGLLGTTLATIPAQVPYLQADPDRVERWGRRLREMSGYRVGIAWQGNRQYADDQVRSIPLAQFALLAAIPRVQLVSLQKGLGAEQLADFRSSHPIFAPDELDVGGAFVDTAAIMQNLDLVITSDSAIAHLAGALGVPVWVALAKVPDWRWLEDREDCPWYPTMRLFRQRRPGNWPEVFARLAGDLSPRVP